MYIRIQFKHNQVDWLRNKNFRFNDKRMFINDIAHERSKFEGVEDPFLVFLEGNDVDAFHSLQHDFTNWLEKKSLQFKESLDYLNFKP